MRYDYEENKGFLEQENLKKKTFVLIFLLIKSK